MSSRKKIGLVGAGVMGSHHARAIAGSDQARLAFVVDPREDIGRKAAEKFETIWLPELPELIDVDGVVVAAATEAHYELAVQVLSEDTALLVEKPIAASLQQTVDVLELAKNKSVPVTCGFLERYNPAVLTAQRLIDSPIHFTSTRHSPYAPRIKTGVAWDLLVHDVDLAVRIFGHEPVSVVGNIGRFHPDSEDDAEDIAEALLAFPSGGLAQVSASRVGQKKIRQVSIYELNRLIEIDMLRKDVTIYNHVSEDLSDGDSRGYRQQTVIEIPELITSKEPLVSQLENFIALIEGSKSLDDERATLLAPHNVINSIKLDTSR